MNFYKLTTKGYPRRRRPPEQFWGENYNRDWNEVITQEGDDTGFWEIHATRT